MPKAKKIFIEGEIKGWLQDIMIEALNSRGKGEFEYTGKVADADIMFSDDAIKFGQHLRGTWKGSLAVFVTDKDPRHQTKTRNGKPYIEVGANKIATLMLEMTLFR